MKRIIIIILLFSSLVSKGQLYQKISTWEEYLNRLRITGMLRPPVSPMTGADKGSFYYRESDSTYLYWSGNAYRPIVGARQVNDSMLLVGKDTITIRGTGGGGADSTVFAPNYRLDTAVANVRTQNAGKQDTTGLLGIKYSANTWSNLNDFNNRNVIASVSGGRILLQPSASVSLDQTLTVKWPSCLEYWSVEGGITYNDVPGATTYGTGVGLASTNSYVTSSVVAYVDHSTDPTNRGRLFISGTYPTVSGLAGSPDTIPHNIGDRVIIKVTREGNKIKATARNLTTNSAAISAEYTYNTTTPLQPLLPNTGEYGFFTLGGQVYVDSLLVFSKEVKNAEVMFGGDSKTVPYYTDYSSGWANTLRASIPNVVISAGGGDRPQEIYSRLPEIIRLRPHQFWLEVGTNESDSAVVKDYIKKINDTLFAHGIPCYHMCFYQTASDAGWRYNFLKRTFNHKYVVNVYDVLKQPNTLALDGMHFQNFASPLIANTILSSGRIELGKGFAQQNSSATGNYIAVGTTPQAADFNVTGTGQAGSWKTSQIGSNAGFHFRNVSSSTGAAESILTPLGGANQSMSFYLEPNGTGAGGTATSIGLFNAPLASGNFGGGIFQMKPAEFDLYTLSAGSGTLVPFKIFVGSNDQLTLNTNGTSRWGGNVFFDAQIAIGPSFTTPFSKALLHSNRSVNNAVYNMISNANTGVGASAGVKANLDPTREDTNYITMMVLGANYNQPSRPTLGGGSALVETTAPGDLYQSAYNDTGDIVFTTDTSMIERMRIAHIGAITFGKGSNSYTFPTVRGANGQALITDGSGNITWQTPSGGSGITSINSLTGASQTLNTGAAGTDFNISSSGTTHTFNIPSASATNRGVVTTTSQTFAGVKTFSDGAAINTELAINLGSDATGDTYYRNGSGKVERLAPGSNGDVLTLSGGLPSWAAPVGNSDLTGGAIKTNVHIVSDANYSVASTDYVILYSSMTVGRTLTLPSAASNTNRMLIIKNGGNGAFNITTSVAMRENSTTSGSSIPPNQSYGLVSDGTDWWIIWAN